jgi:RHS repeat-associated protein
VPALDAGCRTSITSPPSIEWIEEIRYHANGLWSQIDHRNNWTERQTIASHGMQRPLALSAENAAGQQQYTTGSFAYDGAGNVKAMGADSFHYDAHNRLAGGTIDGQGYGYTYDAYGNLTSHTRAGTTVSICIDSRKNRMEEPGSSCPYLEAHQSYFGNIETLQTTNYVYDALDMPIHRNPEPVPPDHTYVYTADEERIWFINAGGGPPPGDGKTGLTAWEGLFLRDLDGTLLRQYSKETATPFVPADAVYTAPFSVSRDSIHRNGQLAVIREPGGVLRHQHLDHLGTPRAISAGNGALVSTHKYSPYGKDLTGSSGNARQFTGHERDSHGAGEDDNLDYMHARFYSLYVGRLLSVDPVGGNPATPQSWNRYAYVEGNPLAYLDPDGLGKLGTFAKIVDFTASGARKIVARLSSREAAKAAQRAGEDLRLPNRKGAEELARELGGGRPPIHELGKGKGQYPHYHPADRSGGHIFYGIAGALTLSHYAQGHGSVLEVLAEVGDIFNPLSLGQDVIDLYEMFFPNGGSAALVQGIQVTAPAGASSYAPEVPLTPMFGSPLVSPTSTLFSGEVYLDGTQVDFQACGRRFCP